MAKTHGSTVNRASERIDLVVDLLIADKSKGEIKRTLRAKFGVAFRTVENDLKKARERLREEDLHIEFAVGLINRLRGLVRVSRELVSEKGVSKRSAARIIEAAIVQRDRSAQVSGAEAKAQIVEAFRQIVRDTDDDRTKIAALEKIASLLGLERIKIDMTLNEEKEVDVMIADEIKALKNGHKRMRLVEANGDDRQNGNGNGRQ